MKTKFIPLPHPHTSLLLQFSHYVYNNAQRLISLADAKAGACFALSGLLIPLVLGKLSEIKVLLISSTLPLQILLCFLLSLALTSTFFSVLTAFFAFSPRIAFKKKQKGHLFFADINLYQGDNSAFYQSLTELSEEEILEDYARQITTLSHILQKKYQMISRSILFTGISGLGWFLFFLCYLILKG
jgi:hypothetical protein